MSTDSLHLWLEESWNDQVALRLRLRACLYDQTSPFQRIAVYDSYALGRILALGGAVVLTEADEAIYSEGLAHPAMACHPAPKQVLILGGGDGGVCREVCRYAGVESVTVVEIDEAVVDAVREHFPACGPAFDDPRVELVIDDAHRFLEAVEETYDLIIVDADQLHDPAATLVQRMPLAEAIKRRLAPDGILVAPLGIPAFNGSACRASLATLRSRFDTVAVYQFTTPSMVGQQWAVGWCSLEREPELVDPAPTISGDLSYWDPQIQASLFALPKHRREQLGL